MAGTAPTNKSWVNREWQNYLMAVASDVRQIQQYMPVFEYALRYIQSSKQLTRTFPAKIVNSAGFAPSGCNYAAVEVLGPRGPQSQTEIPQDPEAGDPKFIASNTYEEGLVCDGAVGSDIVIPPSTFEGCFSGLECNAQPISNNSEGHIVTMHAAVCPTPEPETQCCDCLQVDRILGANTFYWFSAVIQPCLDCSEEKEPPGLLGAGEVLDIPPKDTTTPYDPFQDARGRSY